MAFSTRSSRWVLAAALALAAAACSNSSTGPTTITNPQATIRDLVAVDSAFDSDAYRALAVFSANFVAPTAPAPLQGVVRALGITLPPPLAPGRAAALAHPATQDLRALAGLSTSPQVAVLPDSLLGTTFEWSPDSVRYVATSRTGAPANGITFILYRLNNTTNQPDTAQEVGSLDIIDMAPASGAQLRFVVRGVGGSPTVLDHTLTFLPGANQAYTLQAAGYVSNGRPGSLERRFTFNGSLGSTSPAQGPAGTADFTYDVNVPDVTVELHLATSADTLTDTSITAIDYRFTRLSENVRLQGADTVSNGGNAENGTFAVTVNGNAYATLTIATGVATIRDASGAIVPVNANDQQYEDEVIAALIFGVVDASLRFAEVLAIPALLLGISISLLS